jgi:hypothetical protein
VAAEKKIVIGARTPRGEGKLAEDSDVNICVRARDELPMGQIQAFILKRGSQFLKGPQSADFLERNHVRFQRQDTVAHLGFGVGGFGDSGLGGFIQVIFHIVSDNPEGFGNRTPGEETDQENSKAAKAKLEVHESKQATFAR